MELLSVTAGVVRAVGVLGFLLAAVRRSSGWLAIGTVALVVAAGIMWVR